MEKNEYRYFYSDVARYKSRVEFYVRKIKESTKGQVEDILMRAVHDNQISDKEFGEIMERVQK